VALILNSLRSKSGGDDVTPWFGSWPELRPSAIGARYSRADGEGAHAVKAAGARFCEKSTVIFSPEAGCQPLRRRS
jgi:hypothetical protein